MTTYINPDGSVAQVDPTFVPGGPADPKAPAVQKFYTVMTGILGLVGIASTFGLITQDQSASIGSVAAAAGTLVGAGIGLVASFRTKRQLKNGTFTEAPKPPELPAVSALEQMKILRDQANHEIASNESAAKAAGAVLQDVLGKLPIPGAAAAGAIIGDLSDINDVLGAFKGRT